METISQTPQITLKNISFLKTNQMNMVVQKMRRHIKFYAIFNIVMGTLICLSIIGAILGIPVIIYHLKLIKSADSYQDFVNSNDFFHLNRAFENMRKFFLFSNIIIIIWIVFFILYVAVIIYMISLGMQFPSNFA